MTSVVTGGGASRDSAGMRSESGSAALPTPASGESEGASATT
ncbi:MAG: hypothetical protein M5U28_27335 [Sandaracinaceae bacterium]|nr:hypothetical protein [Sandaracinaceae bacterium]